MSVLATVTSPIRATHRFVWGWLLPSNPIRYSLFYAVATIAIRLGLPDIPVKETDPVDDKDIEADHKEPSRVSTSDSLFHPDCDRAGCILTDGGWKLNRMALIIEFLLRVAGLGVALKVVDLVVRLATFTILCFRDS